MKYLLIALLALAITLPATAQDTPAKKKSFWTMGDDEDSYNRVEKQKTDRSIAPITAGATLKKASNSFITSMVMGVVGGGIVAFGSGSENPDALYAVGGVFGLCSMIYSVRGIVLIGKAGELMDTPTANVALELKPSSNGVTLALKF